jgi:hypothetical protein
MKNAKHIRTSSLLNLINFKQMLDPEDLHAGTVYEGKKMPQLTWGSSSLYVAFITRLMNFRVRRSKFDFQSFMDQFFGEFELSKFTERHWQKHRFSMGYNPFDRHSS